ncbi:MAG TPA: DNA polymerase III subunit chi [Thiolapillus brandeum]|uniref:DNA polymerase III subunit chi n=1 Tax=Thiolapillus brandeum TaxID=1076588 RepID=A0A831RTP1_9GAMM|nr:DNA polymerase III subunit chi [Thiolapillus brandeum]
MTQVDFYILQAGGRGNRYTLAARLTEKAWSSGHRVLIATESEEDLRHMDRLLWVHRDQSFIPHGILGKADPALNPVLLTNPAEAGDEHDVLINLCASIPEYFSRFERVAECVDQEKIDVCRDHYRFYKNYGYQLNTHDIG